MFRVEGNGPCVAGDDNHLYKALSGTIVNHIVQVVSGRSSQLRFQIKKGWGGCTAISEQLAIISILKKLFVAQSNSKSVIFIRDLAPQPLEAVADRSPLAAASRNWDWGVPT